MWGLSTDLVLGRSAAIWQPFMDDAGAEFSVGLIVISSAFSSVDCNKFGVVTYGTQGRLMLPVWRSDGGPTTHLSGQ